MKIIPTILDKNFSEAETKIRLIKDLSNWVQIDVVDGQFTFGKTFELELLNKTEARIDTLLIDIHLMVKDPIRWLEKCIYVGANRINGQVEMMSDRDQFVKRSKDEGLEAGLAFDIDTPIVNIPEETDVVLLMARKAGFGVYPLDENIWKRIDELKKIKEKDGLNFKIGVDGGVNRTNIARFKEAGVDIAYCGGSVFDGNVVDNLEDLRKLV